MRTVKDIINQNKTNIVVVNGREPMVMIKTGNKITSKEDQDIILNSQVKEEFLIKGVIEDILRLTI